METDEEDVIFIKEENSRFTNEENPILIIDDDPIFTKEENSIFKNEETPIFIKDHILTKEENPIFTNEEETVFTKEETPIFTIEENPIFTIDENPIFTNEENPIFIKEENHISTNEENPIFTNEADHIFTKEENPVLTHEEGLLWSVIVNYVKEVDVTCLNLNKRDWKAIAYRYNSHNPTISKMKPKLVAFKWKSLVKRRWEKKTFFKNEEQILWNLVEDYRNAIDVTQIRLNKKDWRNITNIYNNDRDVTRRKRKPTLKRMWFNILKRLRTEDVNTHSFPTNDDVVDNTENPQLNETVHSERSEQVSTGFRVEFNGNERRKKRTVMQLRPRPASGSSNERNIVTLDRVQEINKKRQAVDVRYLKFQIYQANYGRMKAEAELAELKLKLYNQQTSSE